LLLAFIYLLAYETVVTWQVQTRSLAIGVRAGEGLWGCSPHELGKAIIFWANAKFFGQKPAAKNGKCVFVFTCLNEKKTKFIPYSEMKRPNNTNTNKMLCYRRENRVMPL